MIYYYFQNSEERDSTLSALIYVCSFCDSIGRSGELYWNVFYIFFYWVQWKASYTPIPIPLLRVKHWLNGCCISLCLKKLLIHLYMFLNSKWMNKSGGSWDQIINREIKVYGKPYVWNSLATHLMGKLSFHQNLKIFYYLSRFVYKSMSHKISHLKANIETSPNGEHKNQSWNVTGLFQCDLGL